MTAKARSVVFFASAALLLGAAAPTCPDTARDRVSAGNWGGEHVGMVVTDTGATLEYDCAAGRISEPLRLDAAGNFSWSGVHMPGHGGPIRVDEPTNEHPARYTGHATATTIELTLQVLDMPGTAPMTFTLLRGANPHVFKCL